MTLVVFLSLVALTAPASAEPDRSLTLSPDARTASWRTPVNVGSYVYAVSVADDALRCAQDCDETLVRITRAGTLRLDVVAQGPVTAPDLTYLQLTVYRSDAKGSKGKVVGRAATPAGQVTLKNAAAGFYLAEVAWREGVASYDGKASFVPARPR
jgi:hypothetical protein